MIEQAKSILCWDNAQLGGINQRSIILSPEKNPSIFVLYKIILVELIFKLVDHAYNLDKKDSSLDTGLYKNEKLMEI